MKPLASLTFVLILWLCFVLGCAASNSSHQSNSPADSPTPDTLSPKEHLAKAKSLTEPKDLLEAKKHLDAIPSTAPEYKEAQKIKAKVDGQLAQLQEAFQRGQREGFANFAEKYFLNAGMDVYVTLSGPNKTTVTFKYALMSRPTVYQITNDSNFMQQLRDRGFKKAIFTDGFDESWTYNL